MKRGRSYRILCGILTFLMIWQGISLNVMAEGEKESKRTLNISTVQEFLKFAQACNDADYSVGLEVSLQADLDLSKVTGAREVTGDRQAEFKGITNFSGIFKGNLHTISGLELSEGGESIGLFCYVDQGAKVQDLRIKGTIDCSESKISAGGIAGINAGTIQGCYFKGTVSSLGECGGIAGKNGSSGSVVRCGSSGAVDGIHKVGGIVGENRGVITDCANAAAVNADTRWLDFEGDEDLSLSAAGIWNGIQEKLEEGTDFGGIAGYSNGIIAGCSNKAVVGYQHAGKNIGGIVGRQDGQVIRSVNSGRIYGKQDVGGIVGQLEPQMVRQDVEELGNKVTELHDLMGQMIEDMEKMGDDLHGDLGKIGGKSREAGDTADALLTEMRQVVEKNMDVINELARRIDYCMTHFSTALGYLNQALGKGDSMLKGMDQLKKDLDLSGKMEEEDVDLAKQKRIVLESGIGGRLTADEKNPAKGAKVTVTIHTEKGYRLSKLTKTLYGKEAEDVTKFVEGESFVLDPMPEENVTLSAVFSYAGSYAVESNPGGKALLLENQKTLKLQALPGYHVETVNVDGGSNLYAGDESVMVPDCPQDGDIHTIEIHFAKEEAAGEDLGESVPVSVASGVGGNILADKTFVKGGETIRIVTENDPGYLLDVLQIQGGENLAGEVKDGIYEYKVPDTLTQKVEIRASFKRVKLILESAVPGGEGNYVALGQEVVFSLLPETGFYVKGYELRDANGAVIPCQKKYADSEIYTFPAASLGGKTGRLQVIFAKQSSRETVKEAKENLENQTDHVADGVENISRVSQQIKDLLTDESGNHKDPEDLTADEMTELAALLTELTETVADTGVAAGAILGDIGTISRISGPYAEDALEDAGKTMDQVSKDAHELSQNLLSAGKELQGIVDYLNALEKLRAVNLSSNFDQNAEKLKTQLDDVADLLSQLDKHAYLHSEKLEGDMRAVNDKMNEVLSLLVNRLDAMQSMASGEDIIVDLSARDDDSNAKTSLVSDCTNKGVISGDRNVGGVVGTVGVEKVETEQGRKISVGNRYHARSQILECENRGFITVKNENGGGVTGELEIGYVHGCLALGRVMGEDANYLGGIAGESKGTIEACSSLTVLAGNNYVGGIAGQATEIRDCYSMVTVLRAKEWVGAIAGSQAYDDEEEDVTILRGIMKERMAGNYYCSKSLYGINGVSLSGVAQSVSYQELLALDQVPEAFSELGVTFIDADQNVIGMTVLPYGTELSKLEYPNVKTASGEYMEWKGLTGEVLEGNLVLQATEMTNVTILSGGQQGKNKPVALAEGTFTEEARIHIEDYAGTAPSDAPVGSVCHFYKVRLENTALDGDTVTRVRLLRETEGKAIVYRLEDGKWKKLSSKTMGSYEETQMQGTEAVFCVCILKKQINWTMILVIAALVVVILALVVVIIELIIKQRRQKRARKQFWDEGEEQDSEDE